MSQRWIGLLGCLLATAAAAATAERPKTTATLQLQSIAFAPGAEIPRRYTCQGSDLNPALHIRGLPAGTRSLALLVEDPDAPAGLWVHWVYYDLPPTLAHIPEGVTSEAKPALGGTQGKNDFQKIGYGGPCPPPGPAHRYLFTLYALDRLLGLAPGAGQAQVLQAARGHIVGRAELVGRYRRQGPSGQQQ